MNKLPLGTKVKVIKAQAGAYGANGCVGTIVKNQKMQNGLHGIDSEVTIKLEDETVWGIGEWDKIELEVLAPTYNKAQKRCIEQWTEYPDTITAPQHLESFLEEFNLIDPTPDPVKTYSFRMSGGTCIRRGLTKEEADRKLFDQIPGYNTISKDSYELVSFTAGESLTVKSKREGKKYTYIVEEEY